MLQTRLPLAIVAFTLVGCGPKAPPEAAAAADPRVQSFVTEVVALAESHAWNAIVERCDEAQRATQMGEMGMSAEQYVAEQFGLHTVGNSIDTDDNGIDAAELGRVGHFVVTGMTKNGDLTDVHGTVEVHGGPTLHFLFEVAIGVDGRPRLTGAVG